MSDSMKGNGEAAIEEGVSRHYGDGDLLERLLSGLEAAGLKREALRPEDLAPIEEFHIGGRKATEQLLARLSLAPEHRVLDVGCGIGGAVRFLAASVGCQVTGLDLTPEYIRVAKALTEAVGLDGKVHFDTGSALEMPYEDASFDTAISLHAAMNIAARGALYEEIGRVLKPGGTLCLYDVMKKGDGELLFPVPWASSPEISFLTTPEQTQTLLEEAGFEVREIEDRTDFAIEFFRERLTSSPAGGAQPGVHLVMGESAREKFTNTLANIERGCIDPFVMVASRKG
ncbi:MAG TPA: class I SAM-dependent methyltransferase [Gammaproteobacteria bacterium]|nr:class I SAM-dependent methyltransferase [Gammaproteobacteria bacterium]